MRKLFLCLLALSVAGFAFASDLEKKDADVTTTAPLSRGNLDCTNSIGICCGQTLQGDNTGMPNNVINYGTSSLSENGGEVVYCFALPAEQQVTITLVPSGCDLDLWVLGSCDEADVLDYSAGTGTETVIFNCLQPGTYYAVVDGYGSTYPGAECPFEISIECTDCPQLPDNDTCEDAFDLCAIADGSGAFNFAYTTLLATDDYDVGYGGCTGYNTGGGDIVYSVCLEAGGTIDVTQTGDYDMALYLVTDCSDVFTYCVIGSDNCCTGADEFFTYTSVDGGTYYLIVDGYSTEGSGTLYGTVTGCCASATEGGSWGSVKQLFR